jgi:hypothetical protein
MRSSTLIAGVVTAAMSAACATASPPPDRQLADSRAAFRVAEQAGATEDPQAATYLELARKQLADADQEISLRNYPTAERSLRMAQANAELAASLAREAHARAEAADLRRQADELKARVP